MDNRNTFYYSSSWFKCHSREKTEIATTLYVEITRLIWYLFVIPINVTEFNLVMYVAFYAISLVISRVYLSVYATNGKNGESIRMYIVTFVHFLVNAVFLMLLIIL